MTVVMIVVMLYDDDDVDDDDDQNEDEPPRTFMQEPSHIQVSVSQGGGYPPETLEVDNECLARGGTKSRVWLAPVPP